MTLQDARSCPNCSDKVIDFLLEQKLVADEKRELTKDEIDLVCTAMLFNSVGLENNKILDFFNSGNAEKIAMLKEIRAKILDDIHAEQKQLDKVDHILREMQKGAK